MLPHPEIVEERAVLKKLHDDHDGLHSSDNTIQLDNIRVSELTHDGGLREKVIPLFGRGVGLCVEGREGEGGERGGREGERGGGGRERERGERGREGERQIKG